MSSDNALRAAYDKGLDLVLISPNAQPPVCRIVDYGRYRYEQEKREKDEAFWAEAEEMGGKIDWENGWKV